MKRDRSTSGQSVDHRGVERVTRPNMIATGSEIAREIPKIASLAYAEIGVEPSASADDVDLLRDDNPSNDCDEDDRRRDDGSDPKIARPTKQLDEISDPLEKPSERASKQRAAQRNRVGRLFDDRGHRVVDRAGRPVADRLLRDH